MSHPAGDDRVWSGSVTLGDFWSVYIGQSDQNAPHAHVALQIALGVSGDVTVHVGRRRLQAPGMLIRPLAKHTVSTGRQVALIYVEPQSPLGRGLLESLDGRSAMVLPDELLPVRGDVADAAGLLDRIGATLRVSDRAPLDGRLARALEVLERSGGGTGAVGAAAKEAGLSTARLRALAGEQLGAPLARWVLWRKLERAGRALAAGASLVEAAASGGFADQAHFTRTMRRMFGVTPRVAAATLR